MKPLSFNNFSPFPKQAANTEGIPVNLKPYLPLNLKLTVHATASGCALVLLSEIQLREPRT